ncbi:MAG: dockerin type I domain-containing protein [Rubripirellula sp.]
MEIDSEPVISHAYNRSIVDGHTGLVTIGGRTEFSSLTIASDDPAFLDLLSNNIFGDVNLDGAVTAGDTLVVIIALSQRWKQSVSGESLVTRATEQTDAVVQPDDRLHVNGDGRLSALDALVVINQLAENKSSQVPAITANTLVNQAISGSSATDYINIDSQFPNQTVRESNTALVNIVLAQIQRFTENAARHGQWQAEGEGMVGETNPLTADAVDEVILAFGEGE